jgi:hypothetical protein
MRYLNTILREGVLVTELLKLIEIRVKENFGNHKP